MATGKSGTLTWTSGSFSLRVTWSETYDPNANTSSVSIGKLEVMSTSYSGDAYYPDGKIQVNGTTVYTFNSLIGNEMADVRAKNTWYSIVNSSSKVEISYSPVENIAHNSDGSKSINITLASNRYSQFSFFTAGGGSGSGWGVSGSQKIALTDIPRSSSITSVTSSVELGKDCSVKWTPATDTFYYKLKFSMGTWSETIKVGKPGHTSAFTFVYTIPLGSDSDSNNPAKNITTSTSGTMTVYLGTYSDSGYSNKVGSTSSKTFTVTVPSSIKPTVSSASISVDNNANSTVEEWGLCVAGYSKVKIVASASGSYGSTISSYTISGGYSKTISGTSLSWTGDTISSSGDKTFKVVAKDSRGRSSASIDAGTITVYPYSSPTISSFRVERSSSNAEKMIVVSKWTYASVNGKNSATATLKYKKSSDTAWSTYDGTISNGTNNLAGTFEETSSYNFSITIKDALGKTVTSEVDVATIQVLMDFRPGGKGLGIGKIAETDSFEVAMESKFYNNLYISDDFEIHSFDATGKSRSVLKGISSEGNTILGYGNYINADRNTNIYGDKVGFYTNKGIYTKENSLYFENNYSIYGADTKGNYLKNFIPCSENDNTAVGYGNYVNASGNTLICGNDVLIYSAAAGKANYKPYYRTGDSTTVNIETAGFLTSSNTVVCFTIPLCKPVIGNPTITLASTDGFTLRQNDKYTHGSSSEVRVHPTSFTVQALSTAGIRVRAEFSNTENSINNSAIGIKFVGSITFS